MVKVSLSPSLSRYFDTIPPWKVVGTYYLDISYVAFKYFDFLSVSDKLELLGHVHEPP